MITHISLVSLWVKDIDESFAFYTDVLGFVAKDDIHLGPDFRWCTVIHPRQPELQVHLTTPSRPLSDDLIAAMQRAQSEGGLPGIGLSVARVSCGDRARSRCTPRPRAWAAELVVLGHR